MKIFRSASPFKNKVVHTFYIWNTIFLGWPNKLLNLAVLWPYHGMWHTEEKKIKINPNYWDERWEAKVCFHSPPNFQFGYDFWILRNYMCKFLLGLVLILPIFQKRHCNSDSSVKIWTISLRNSAKISYSLFCFNCSICSY